VSLIKSFYLFLKSHFFILTPVFSVITLFGFFSIYKRERIFFWMIISLLLFDFAFFSTYSYHIEYRYFFTMIPFYLIIMSQAILDLFQQISDNKRRVLISLLFVFIFAVSFKSIIFITNYAPSPFYTQYRLGLQDAEEFSEKIKPLLPASATIMSVYPELAFYLDSKHVQIPYSDISYLRMTVKKFDVDMIILKKGDDVRISPEIDRLLLDDVKLDGFEKIKFSAEEIIIFKRTS
jgi:hypothetical protein